MKHIYTSVDIGSDTIKVVVCELYNGKLNLLAASSVKSKGIRKGLITDSSEASDSLKKAINEVESMLGIKIKNVITSIPSYFAEFTMIQGSINITGENNTVTGKDVIDVLQAAMHTKNLNKKEMVTIIPIDFRVDDKESVKNPKGLVGNTLSARGVMVTTPRKNIFSVVNLFSDIGVEVVDISLNCIGDINSFRTASLESKVGAVINIGCETTEVSLYNKGIVVKNSIIQMGGKKIDNDIAYMYKISNLDANKLKEKFALAHKKNANPNEFYELSEDFKINQLEISEIVMATVEEILELAKKEISALASKKIEYIIITGGTSNMIGFDLVADQVFGKNTVIGSLNVVGLRNNKYSSAIGNIIYFINKLKLKGQDYTMVSSTDSEYLSSSKKEVNFSNDSMLGKVFGFFFSD